MPDSGRHEPDKRGDPSLGEPSLEDLIAQIQADDALSASKRTHWTCSIRRMAAFLERHPGQLPARLSALRHGIARLHHQNLGVSRKSLQNHLANFKAALGYAQQHTKPGRGAPMDRAWTGVMASIENIGLRRALSSFARYCSMRSIAPEAVDDGVIEAFVEWRTETSFVRKPKDLHKQVARALNRLAGLQNGIRPVTVPDFRPKARSLFWDAFPESLWRDIEAYLQWLGGGSLDEDGPARPCAASTLNRYRLKLRLLASAAVRAGVDPAALRCLADLVAPPVAKSALEQYLKENGGGPTVYIADLAGLLCSTGSRWCGLSEADLGQLGRYRGKLDRSRRKGLTDKNMAVVRQVLDEAVWNRVKALPQQLMDQALDPSTAPHKAAVKAELAVAIQLLIVAPMRIGNLCALSLESNLVRPSGPRGPLHIVIPDHDVKNRVPLEYPLPRRVTELH